MFTWMGFFGKILEYVAKKLLDKTIDPTLSARKQACTGFAALFDAAVELEYLTHDLAKRLHEVADRSQPRIDIRWFTDVSDQIDTASIEFLNRMTELQRIINLYDPRLAVLLGRIKRAKKGNMIAASMPEIAEKLLLSVDNAGVLTFSAPDETFNDLDLEIYYQTIDEMRHSTDTEWPSGLLLTLLEDHVIQGSIELKDEHAVRNAALLADAHVEQLSSARKCLAEFIRTEFSIEDLLFANRRNPR